ncbi:hypothetical protein ACIBF6_44690 [Streptosporangium amethystogenes]|uniref:hypothetical protein n=1 Tax=Streptosporangium amethystogenes TaxID=2002 RepID=UPI00378FB3F2
MAGALERVNEISAFRLAMVDLSTVSPNRMATLARYGLGSRAPSIARAGEPKRTTMLVAVMRHLEAVAIDDALDLFGVLMAARLFSPARRASERDRLGMLPQLEKASRLLARASRVLIEQLELTEQANADLDVAGMWRALESVATREAVIEARQTVERLVPEDDGSADAAMRAELANRYNTVRPFLSLLGESSALGAAAGGRRVLAAVTTLPELARRKVGQKPLRADEVDEDLVPPVWRRAVFANPDLPPRSADRNAYVVCVLEQLYRALNRRDVYAAPSGPAGWMGSGGSPSVRTSWRA